MGVPHSQRETGVSFGSFGFDFATGRLRKHGREVKIQALPLLLLASPLFVVTVPRQGYGFIASVSPANRAGVRPGFFPRVVVTGKKRRLTTAGAVGCDDFPAFSHFHEMLWASSIDGINSPVGKMGGQRS